MAGIDAALPDIVIRIPHAVLYGLSGVLSRISIAVEHVVATTNHRLAVIERSPGKVDPRTPIIKVGWNDIAIHRESRVALILNDSRHSGIGVGTAQTKPRVGMLPGLVSAENVVTKPEVERQFGSHAEIVLRKKAPVAVTHVRLPGSGCI